MRQLTYTGIRQSGGVGANQKIVDQTLGKPNINPMLRNSRLSTSAGGAIASCLPTFVRSHWQVTSRVR
jgi:hypothetical protein